MYDGGEAEKRGTPGIVEGALTMSQSVSPLSFIAVTDRVLYTEKNSNTSLNIDIPHALTL